MVEIKARLYQTGTAMQRISTSFFKAPHYVDSNLCIPKLPMSLIVMHLLGEYPETENGNCYALTIICMLTSFVSSIPIKDKKNENVINSYIKYIYAHILQTN